MGPRDGPGVSAGADVLVPQAGPIPYEVPHERDAFGIVEHHDPDPVPGQPVVPPWNVRASPITTREIPNCRTRPEQYQHGESVVTIVVPRYERCRPAARKAAVSACSDGSPSCTRRLCPRPRSEPSGPYSAAPMGMPPSASPVRASARAVASMALSFTRACSW